MNVSFSPSDFKVFWVVFCRILPAFRYSKLKTGKLVRYHLTHEQNKKQTAAIKGKEYDRQKEKEIPFSVKSVEVQACFHPHKLENNTFKAAGELTRTIDEAARGKEVHDHRQTQEILVLGEEDGDRRCSKEIS